MQLMQSTRHKGLVSRSSGGILACSLGLVTYSWPQQLSTGVVTVPPGNIDVLSRLAHLLVYGSCASG